MKRRRSNNFRHCKEEEEEATINLVRSINDLMSARGGYGSFERVSLKGENVGAAMTVRNGTSGESVNCCNINIYVNNNVQGVNNSVLVGSEVKVLDAGVSLSMRDVMQLGKGFVEKNRRTRASDLGFLGLFLAVVLVGFLLVSLF